MSEQSLPDETEVLSSLKLALDAAKLSLRASQEVGDQSTVIKSSRAIADIAARLSRIQTAEEDNHSANAETRNDVIREFIKALKGDDEHRKQVIESLEASLKPKRRRPTVA